MMADLQVSARQGFRRLMLASAAVLVTAPALIAQAALATPASDESGASSSRRFVCAPHLATFVVRSHNPRLRGRGIRCVKLSNGGRRNQRTPRIAWYGEGRWAGKSYRHVGHAFYRGPKVLQGYASDMFGNGEHFKGNFNGTLKLRQINPNLIRVTGAWNEDWIRVKTAVYTPLRRPRRCGKHFDQYRVRDLMPVSRGGRKGAGLRCVLRVGPAGSYAPKKFFTTWFGNGYWKTGVSRYSHIGTRSTKGAGAGDICGAPFGPICNNFAYGSLVIQPVIGGYNVTGAWREKWR